MRHLPLGVKGVQSGKCMIEFLQDINIYIVGQHLKTNSAMPRILVMDSVSKTVIKVIKWFTILYPVAGYGHLAGV